MWIGIVGELDQPLAELQVRICARLRVAQGRLDVKVGAKPKARVRTRVMDRARLNVQATVRVREPEPELTFCIVSTLGMSGMR